MESFPLMRYSPLCNSPLCDSSLRDFDCICFYFFFCAILLRKLNKYLFFQESDIAYVARHLWSCQSVLSGARPQDGAGDDGASGAKDDFLQLTKWRAQDDWSPWNCALMTRDEARLHERSGSRDAQEMYGPTLTEKVRHRQALARAHFARVSTMAGYFQEENNGAEE